jgi:cell division septation protein DedD
VPTAPAAPTVPSSVAAASVVQPSPPALPAKALQPQGGDAGAVPVPAQLPVQSPVVMPDPPLRVPPATADQAPALPAKPQPPAMASVPASTALQTTSAEPGGVLAVAPPTVTPGVQTGPPVAPAASYAINVGLFADAGNARRAQALLQQAGLPVVVQAITTVQGPRTRVRVGPYPQRERADEAAARIRMLGLEAVVFPIAYRP